MNMSERDNSGRAVKAAVFHILLAMAERELHGYGVIQAVREQSGGQVPLNTASFYRHLNRLLEDGLVEESAKRPANADARRGAYYRTTAAGHAVLRAERGRLAGLVASLDALRPSRRKPQ